MYLSTLDRRRFRAAGRTPRAAVTAVGGNVLALGTVSLLTDVSAEMVTAVLPLYFVLTLHLTPAAYGVVDGLYTGATALLRLAGGYAADRFRRRKAVAAAGYGLSALAKLGLLAAGGSVAALGGAIVADRAGKGLRTAPRDALITESAPEPLLGRAFGIHRAMDGAGAFAGPLAALAVLSVTGASSQAAFGSLFVTSFCVAAAGLLVLLLFVRDRPAGGDRPAWGERPAGRAGSTGRAGGAPGARATPRAALGLLRDPRIRRLAGGAALLGLATVGDGFVYLVLLRRGDLAAGWFPLFAVSTNLVYLLLAGPFGALADRVGRKPMLLSGYAALAAVYALLGLPLSGTPLTVAVLALYGTFYAATDGVLMALVGPALPGHLRTTGLAYVQTAQALAYLVSSVVFGFAWTTWGPARACALAAGAVTAALAVTAVLLPARTGPPDAAPPGSTVPEAAS